MIHATVRHFMFWNKSILCVLCPENSLFIFWISSCFIFTISRCLSRNFGLLYSVHSDLSNLFSLCWQCFHRCALIFFLAPLPPPLQAILCSYVPSSIHFLSTCAFTLAERSICLFFWENFLWFLSTLHCVISLLHFKFFNFFEMVLFCCYESILTCLLPFSRNLSSGTCFYTVLSFIGLGIASNKSGNANSDIWKWV